MTEPVPHEGTAEPQLHPARLAAIAKAFGAEPPAVSGARILEIGCGPGWGLLAMACGLPEAQLVGIDPSPERVARGRQAAEALGLSNVTLLVSDGASIPEAARGADYIIADARLAWDQDTALPRILEICGDALSPAGVAVVRYDCLPGWRYKQAAREMLQYHALTAESPDEAVTMARGFMTWLADAVTPQQPAMKLNLERESAWMEGLSDPEVLHDHLATLTRPVYFHQFVGAAAGQGLRYVADAHYGANRGRLLPPELARDLSRIADEDLVRFEQYQDFTLGRSARESIVTRADAPLVHEPWGKRVAELFVASRCERAGPEPETGAPTWRIADTRYTVTNQVDDTVLQTLAQAWPEALSVRALHAAVLEACPPPPGLDDTFDALCDQLLDYWAKGLVDLAATPLSAARARETPAVSRLVRYELSVGKPVLTSGRHRPRRVDEPLRLLAGWVDGTRDREGLVDALEAAIARGDLTVPPGGAEAEQLRESLRGVVDDALGQLERLGLLEAGA